MIHNVVVNGEVSAEEVKAYKEYVEKKFPQATSLEITPDGNDVILKYYLPEIKYDRTRRITGYLVGSVDRWNDAKKAELKDRVKHEL